VTPAPEPAATLPARNVLAWDHGWQFPAITEQQAFHRVCATGGAPAGVVYVAYPWATLIDKLQVWAPDAAATRDAFRAFAATLPQGLPKVTVCQHILMRQYLHLFAEAGIDDIFWSHATQDDAAAARDPGTPGPRLHPFPLYPVQVTQEAPESGPRRHLFSFIGAKASPWYMTRVRDWILADLAEDPRGLVLGKAEWHFHRVVYDHQIRQVPGADTAPAEGEDFAALLRDTVFALCPSGTGPNSIRLWEALGAGAVPVILSDRWAPPGDPALWAAAAVTCPETPEALRALPDRLEALARDEGAMAAMRAAGRRLWALYGPQNFIPDLQARMAELAARPDPLDSARPDLRARAQALREAAAPSEGDMALFLTALATAALLPAAGDEGPEPAQAEALCRARLPEGHPALTHLDRVRQTGAPLAHIRRLQAALDRSAADGPALAAAEAALAEAGTRAAAADKALADLTAARDLAWTRAAQRTEDLRHARDRITALEADLRHARRDLPQRLADLEAERAHVFASLSWRVTEPLRGARRTLDRLRALWRR
jgi:hypothetical protein